jgi:hypothetical protein
LLSCRALGSLWCSSLSFCLHSRPCAIATFIVVLAFYVGPCAHHGVNLVFLLLCWALYFNDLYTTNKMHIKLKFLYELLKRKGIILCFNPL